MNPKILDLILRLFDTDEAKEINVYLHEQDAKRDAKRAAELAAENAYRANILDALRDIACAIREQHRTH